MVNALGNLTFKGNQINPYGDDQKKNQNDQSVKGANSLLLHPNPPKGFLVPYSHDKGIKAAPIYNKALKNGLKGEANDYELGKLNDLGLITASTVIATLLATQKGSAKLKAMEFVGAATFLGLMELWPMLAIQKPLEAMHGVNVGQKYEDSQGRTKKLFQDPQYIPFDLFTDEDYAKMAKKMNIPEDAPNRNELVQEKAHKIAIQANTLWMLTAGLGSAGLAALVCHTLEEPIGYLTETGGLFVNDKVRFNLIKPQTVDGNYKPKNIFEFKRLEKTLNNQKDSIIDEKGIDNILNHFIEIRKGDNFLIDARLNDVLKNQIIEIIVKNNETKEYSKDAINNLLTNEKSVIKSFDVANGQSIKNILGDNFKINGDINSKEDLINYLDQAIKQKLKLNENETSNELSSKKIAINIADKIDNYLTKPIELDTQILNEAIIKNIKEGNKLVDINGKTYQTGALLNILGLDKNNISIDDLNNLKSDESIEGIEKSKMANALIDANTPYVKYKKTSTKEGVYVLNESSINDIERLFKNFDALVKQEPQIKSALDVLTKDGSGDTYIARRANKYQSMMLNALGITSPSETKAIINASGDNKGIYEILDKKFTQIARNEKLYKTIVEKSSKLMSELLKEKEKQGNKFDFALQKLLKHFENSEFEILASRMIGYDEVKEQFSVLSSTLKNSEKVGTLKEMYLQKINQEFDSTITYIAKGIRTLDLYKRISNGTLQTQISNNNTKEFSGLDYDTIVKVLKEVELTANSKDYYDGFAKFKDGNDSIPKAITKLLYPTSGSESAREAIAANNGKNDLYTALLDESTKKFISEDVQKALGNIASKITTYFEVERNTALQNGDALNNIKPKELTSLPSSSVVDMVLEGSKQKLNTMHWRGLFGGIGLVLLATTGLAISMIGKTAPVNNENNKKKGVIA